MYVTSVIETKHFFLLLLVHSMPACSPPGLSSLFSPPSTYANGYCIEYFQNGSTLIQSTEWPSMAIDSLSTNLCQCHRITHTVHRFIVNSIRCYKTFLPKTIKACWVWYWFVYRGLYLLSTEFKMATIGKSDSALDFTTDFIINHNVSSNIAEIIYDLKLWLSTGT